MRKQQNNDRFVWVLVVLLVITATVFFFFGPGQQYKNQVIQNFTGQPGVPVYAPQGGLISGFPKSLILDAQAQVSGSYGISYSSDTNQYTAEWNSPNSMENLYNVYLNYLQSNQWQIVNRSTQYPNSKGLYATSGSADVSVAITAQVNGSHVILSYLMK